MVKLEWYFESYNQEILSILWRYGNYGFTICILHGFDQSE